MADQHTIIETPELESSKLNRLDPMVRHDPSLQSTPVVLLNSDVQAEAGMGNNSNEFDMKRINAVAIPVIRIANQIIDPKLIKYMYFDYDKFVPEIVLIVSQYQHTGEMVDVPGMYADMTVVMSPQVNGAYKKVSVDFYVREIEYHSNEIVYHATYKLTKIDQVLSKQIAFPGCSSKYCQLKENNHPTTYEFLHEVAINELGLGLAATDQVKEIKDDKVRLLHSEKLYDAIQKHVRFGGVDKDSIFDCWVDLYRYLVVVNLPYILNEDVKPNEIGTKATVGIDPTNSAVGEDEETDIMYRFITNFKGLPDYTNITFTNYKFEVDNTFVQDYGAINSIVTSNPVGVGEGNNGCSQQDIKLNDDSIDGVNRENDYAFNTQECLGPEFGSSDDGNAPILIQGKLHDAYMRKLRAKRLMVEMDSMNLGLQRGILVNVAIYEYHTQNKQFMAGNYQNVYNDDGVKSTDEFDSNADPDSQIEMDEETARNVDNGAVGFLNTSISGMYYIDGMSFEYDAKYQKIVQRIWLIRKGMMGNYSNATSMPKITDRE